MRDAKVVGGVAAKFGQQPWQVSLDSIPFTKIIPRSLDHMLSSLWESGIQEERRKKLELCERFAFIL